jgi:hypothetical protein
MSEITDPEKFKEREAFIRKFLEVSMPGSMVDNNYKISIKIIFELWDLQNEVATLRKQVEELRSTACPDRSGINE